MVSSCLIFPFIWRLSRSTSAHRAQVFYHQRARQLCAASPQPGSAVVHCNDTAQPRRTNAAVSERRWHGTCRAIGDETARKGGMTRVDGRDTRDILDRHRVLRILLALVTVLVAMWVISIVWSLLASVG